MKVSIDLTSIIMVITVFLLLWIIFDMVKTRKEKPSPVIVRDVEVYDDPTWYGWVRAGTWWPWNWPTSYWGSGSHGNAWFGPGKPCHGWHCDKDHKDPQPLPAPQPAPAPAPQPAPEPIVINKPVQTLPIQDIPVEPPTAQQDIQVALAPTPQAIAPPPSQTNIGTQTEAPVSVSAPVSAPA